MIASTKVRSIQMRPASKFTNPFVAVTATLIPMNAMLELRVLRAGRKENATSDGCNFKRHIIVLPSIVSSNFVNPKIVAETLSIESLVQQHFPTITDQKLRAAIAEVGKYMQFKPGDVIMDYGTYIKIFPLVIKGTIKVIREDEEGNEIFLYYLTGGDICASSFTCCMMDKKSFIRAVAEEEAEIIGIPVKYADIWMTEFANWKNFIMQGYDNRIFELVQTIDSIAFMKMDERLLKYLSEKSKALQSKTINTTHQEIAYDLNASREAVSRLLKQLEQNGTVRLGRNKVELLEN